MPIVSGVGVIEAIVSSSPRCGSWPSPATAYLTAAKNAGAHLALAKPFDSVELLRAVEPVMSAVPR